MATIRDLVRTLERREGIDAAIVLGRDGLLIDGACAPTYEVEDLAVLVPPVALAAIDLGQSARTGNAGLMVLEYDHGTIIISAISPDAFLFLLVRPSANLAALLFELRRHRPQLAALV
jgi:predicted regulator of Ras-like GTPase activity (Roadblock/LC7/MglB family)